MTVNPPREAVGRLSEAGAGAAPNWMAAARPTAARACRQKGSTHRGPSALHAKNDAHDALHVIEALRVQFVGHLDVVVVCSRDFERKACGRKLEEPQREVAGVGIVIVCLDVADTSVIVLELTLNDEIGVLSCTEGSKSSTPGGSLSNETSKYSSQDSPKDTFFA